MRDEAFELQLARWLEDGPFEAPSAPIAAALAHVRAHPERPAPRTGGWRHLVSTIGITHVPSQPRRGLLLAAAVAVVAIMVVAGGYGLLGLGPSTGPGAPTATPVVTPPATQTLGPTPTLATGTQTCATSTEGVVTKIDGVDQSRGEVISCRNTSSDPRLEGDFTTTWNWDEHPDGLWLGWGAIELRNDGGAWTGIWAAESTATANVMEFDSVWIGSGGYEGLEVLNHVRIAGATTVTSRVFEAGPTVTGPDLCRTTSRGRTVDLGETEGYRDVVVECTDTMSDPRLSGERSLRFAIDMRADDSADVWGTSTVTNVDGTWEGFFFGTVDPGYTTHHVKTLMRGTGAYEGLLFRLDVVGDGTTFQLSGEMIAGS